MTQENDLEAAAEASENPFGEIFDLMETSFQPVHEYAQVDENDFPHLDLDFYRAQQERLELQGYRWFCDLEDRTLSGAPGMVFLPILVRCLTSRDGWTVAALYHAAPEKKKQKMTLFDHFLKAFLPGLYSEVEARYVVDLISEFKNGHFVSTSNAGMDGMMMGGPKVHAAVLPEDSDFKKVLRRHAKSLAHFQAKHPGVAYVTIRTYDEIVASQNRLNALKAEQYRGGGEHEEYEEE